MGAVTHMTRAHEEDGPPPVRGWRRPVSFISRVSPRAPEPPDDDPVADAGRRQFCGPQYTSPFVGETTQTWRVCPGPS